MPTPTAPRTGRRPSNIRAAFGGFALAALVAASAVGGVGSEVLAGKNTNGKPKTYVKVARAAQSGQRAGAHLVAITSPAAPFAFAKAAKLASIDRLALTLTLDEADTAPGGTDAGELFLALDGFNTGIPLDGFRDMQTDTRTVSGAPANADAILKALQADGKLVATIIDLQPNDNILEAPANAEATLELRGSLRAKK